VALRERALAAAPTRRAAVALAGLSAALVVLTALVAAGGLTRLDQYSVDHWMPWLKPNSEKVTGTSGYYQPFTLHTSTWSKILDLWTYPCSLLISLLVVIWAAAVLWRRYGPVVALLPAAGWVIGNGVEVIGKGAIVRPALYGGSAHVHIGAFDTSFPSGHMIRGIVVAFAFSLVFPRATRWAALWAVLVAPVLVVQAAHTVTDVIGGILIGLIMVVLAIGVLREEGVELGRA
jgi:membrane-associated phospholipid phosphatase